MLMRGMGLLLVASENASRVKHGMGDDNARRHKILPVVRQTTKNMMQSTCKNCGVETSEKEGDCCQVCRAVNDQINKLYREAAPDDLLRADLLAEGIKTLEDAYVQGFRHGLAELKMRLAEPSNIRS